MYWKVRFFKTRVVGVEGQKFSGKLILFRIDFRLNRYVYGTSFTIAFLSFNDA